MKTHTVGKAEKSNRSVPTNAQKKSSRNSSNAPLVGSIQALAEESPQVGQAIQLQAMANHHGPQPVMGPSKANNTGLPDRLKSGVENLSGYSMDDVKVHYNSDKPAQLNAHAYAQGTNIHLAPGQERHLPHEAWHVVQQKQGRVQPTMQMKGGVDVNDDKVLEREADVMGEQSQGYTHQKKTSHFTSYITPHCSQAVYPKSNSILRTGSIMQLVLDSDQCLPSTERTLDDFLAIHNCSPAKYTSADYSKMQHEFQIILGISDATKKTSKNESKKAREKRQEAKQDAKTRNPKLYINLVAFAQANELKLGNPTWNKAANKAADTYLKSSGKVNIHDSSLNQWNLIQTNYQMPTDFELYVQGIENTRNQEIQNEYNNYKRDGKLLPGTIKAIKDKIGPYKTLNEVQDALRIVYDYQTNITRNDWLDHLEIAGKNVKVDNDKDHYTTFNNAVFQNFDINVNNDDVQTIMRKLFSIGHDSERIHSTCVDSKKKRYHRYYSPNPNNKIYLPVIPNDQIKTRLDMTYDKMITHLENKIQEAIDCHGRVGDNKQERRTVNAINTLLP